MFRRGRSEEGFEEFFRATLPRARRVANRILGAGPDAEDAVGEAYARALVRWRRVSALPYREAWVLRVTANVAVDLTRRRPVEAQPVEHERPVDAAVDRIALAAALRGLAPRQREAIALRYLAGLSVEEVAEVLSLSVNTVKTHTSRGIETLRASLGDWKDEPGWL